MSLAPLPFPEAETSVASASTTDIGATPYLSITVTGTTTITSFGSSAPTGAVKFVKFSGALLLTHNATSLILPGGANVSTTTGDCLTARHEGSGNWRVLHYTYAAGTRERLSANRTYYVRTDGSDSNTGLVDSAGGAFLTVQKAVNTIATLDLNGFTATAQVRDGTYTGAVILKEVVGYSAPGCLVIQGNSGTPANVVISTTSANAFTAANIAAVWDIKDLQIQTTTSGTGIRVTGARVRYGNVNFGACATAHTVVEFGAYLEVLSSYTISGNSAWHWFLQGSAVMHASGITITLSGTPAFGTEFVRAASSSYANVPSITFSGSATGTRYLVSLNGVVNTNGGGASYFPGNAAGSTATGGQYL